MMATSFLLAGTATGSGTASSSASTGGGSASTGIAITSLLYRAFYQHLRSVLTENSSLPEP